LIVLHLRLVLISTCSVAVTEQGREKKEKKRKRKGVKRKKTSRKEGGGKRRKDKKGTVSVTTRFLLCLCRSSPSSPWTEQVPGRERKKKERQKKKKQKDNGSLQPSGRGK